MVWQLPSIEHKVFQRNPLVAVVVELRFHPILRVESCVTEFQDRVRDLFPVYKDFVRQMVNLQPAIEVRNERVFSFSKVDESEVLSLGTSRLAFESRRHESRDAVIEVIKRSVETLTELCGDITPVRLGMLYVNLIDKEAIERDLGRTSAWTDLITPAFLAVPTGLATFADSFFVSEVTSTVPTGGKQTLKYGLISDVTKRVQFRIDIDRFMEEGIVMADLSAILEGFADDIFSVFHSSMGPDLQAWMPVKGA